MGDTVLEFYLRGRDTQRPDRPDGLGGLVFHAGDLPQGSAVKLAGPLAPMLDHTLVVEPGNPRQQKSTIAASGPGGYRTRIYTHHFSP
jgi:hypothetical protein